MIDYAQLIELIKARRSVREFEKKAVSRDVVCQLLEAATWAPSNHNRQPWKFLVLNDPEFLPALAQKVRAELEARLQTMPDSVAQYGKEMIEYACFFGEAPLVLVVLHKHTINLVAEAWQGIANPALVSGEPLSAAMAVQNLLLAAQALGLGACVLTAPLLAPQTMATLAPPAGMEITCLVTIGYPAKTPSAPRRKSLEHIVEFRNTQI